MTTCLLLISDGREDYLRRTQASAAVNLPDFDHVVHIDDTHHTLGFAGAIQAGWDLLPNDCDHVFHLEADFTFNRPVPLDDMISVLRGNPHLTQLALLRQPWNRAEQLAGGVWQQHPDSYTHCGLGDCRWLEHGRHFTTNPCVYPKWVAERGWPQCNQSEGHFGLQLFAEDSTRRSAYWGQGEEWVRHIGENRAGHGY